MEIWIVVEVIVEWRSAKIVASFSKEDDARQFAMSLGARKGYIQVMSSTVDAELVK